MMQRGYGHCLMASSSHTSSPIMTVALQWTFLFALALLKGNLFDMWHMDILILRKDGHSNESSTQMLLSFRRSISTSVFSLGSEWDSSPLFSDSIIIYSIWWHSSTLKCCNSGSCLIIPLENIFFNMGHLVNVIVVNWVKLPSWTGPTQYIPAPRHKNIQRHS